MLLDTGEKTIRDLGGNVKEAQAVLQRRREI